MNSVQIKPTISFQALQKTAPNLKVFVDIYCSFHEVSDDDFYKYFPVLVYTEATIYQGDEEQEDRSFIAGNAAERGETLFRVLEEQGLMDDIIKKEFQKGIDYWSLEKKMLAAEEVTEEDIEKAIEYRTTDFRVLHRLLFRLMGKPYDEELLDVFWMAETLADLEDDINTYEKDINDDAFNVYRMFVKRFGVEAKERLIAFCEGLKERIEEKLSRVDPASAEKLKQYWELYQNMYPSPEMPEPIIE